MPSAAAWNISPRPRSTPWFGYQILDHLAEHPWHVPRNEDMAHEPLIVFVRPEDLPGVEAFMQDRWERHQPSPTDQPLDLSSDICPACGCPLPEEAPECPDCGLCFGQDCACLAYRDTPFLSLENRGLGTEVLRAAHPVSS